MANLAGRLIRHAFRRARTWPPGWRIGGGALAVLGLAAVLAWRPGGSTGPSAAVGGMPADFVAAERPVVKRLALVGAIEPGAVVNLTAPFEGTIKDKIAEFGTRVEQGQALLVLDTTEIDLQLREAEAAKIKAEQAVADMKNWSSNPEVLRARNQVTAARMKVEELERKEAEASTLLSRGIIPRVEHDGVVEQLKAQKLQLAGAQQDLDALLKRGGDEQRRLAQLELETARRRLDDLQRRLDAGLVEAPASGLLLRPAAGESKGPATPAEIEVGSRVAKGQPMFSIADTASLRVVARLDEIDVNKVAEGMEVEVSGEAFGGATLPGRIVHISAQADSSSRNAVFQVVVALAAPSELRHRIRVGMSANLSIVTYRNPAALLVPAEAVRSGPDGDYVLVRRAESPEPVRRPVKLGQSLEEGVEIAEGLGPGETVVVNGLQPASPPPAAAGSLTVPAGAPTGMGRL